MEWVAAALNREMGSLRDERAAVEARQEAFQRDLAALSHDIRTPLSGAQGYLQLYGRVEGDVERSRCLREAAERLAVMHELTDRLFDYSKAIDGDSPLELEPIEMMPALASVLASAYPQIVERGWEPTIDFADEGVEVLVDGELLARVFSNLLANALRHGSSASVITQSVLASSGVDMVVVSFANEVDDPGSIDPDRLFERFYRADGARSGTGSGLGLAIVASLCERMGGFAGAEVEGGCLRVFVCLPAAAGAA